MRLDPSVYARLALDAYAKDRTPDIGQTGTSARGIISTTEDGKVIAFPGTDNIATWLADLDCGRTSTAIGAVHGGIHGAATRIYQSAHHEAPCVLTGHSEGAALALMIAGYLCLDGSPPDAVFAFEPPQICVDDRLGAILRQGGVKVVITRNGLDVVPVVPRLLFPWRHPAERTDIGTPMLMIDNTEDHCMFRVLAAVAAARDTIMKAMA